MQMQSYIKKYNTILGIQLKELRTSNGFTLDQVAGKTSISRQHISHIEKGTNVSLDKLIRLCKLYDISLEDMFGKVTYEIEESNKKFPKPLLEAKKEMENYGYEVNTEALYFAANFEFKNRKAQNKKEYIDALKNYFRAINLYGK